MLRLCFARHLTKARHHVLQPLARSLSAPVSKRFYAAAVQQESSHPDHHAPARKAPSEGQRQRRLRYRLKLSPTDLLVRKVRSRGEPLTWDGWEKTRLVARSRSARLAVLTHQLALRQDEARMETSVSTFLQDPAEWKSRLNRIAYKGINWTDLDHWLWILGAEDTDAKVERFISTDRHKPIFLLMAILRTDEHMRKGSSLVSLYDYIARTYFRSDPMFRQELPKGALRRSLDDAFNMTPTHFMLLIKRVVHHCLKTWPSSIVTIARLVVSYLRTIPADATPNKPNRRTGYAHQCRIFNHALCSFRRVSSLSPLDNLQYNWKAQKILLGFSAGLRRPLVINRWSYRSIRVVLLGLKKSQAEKRTAVRHAKTWPPYRKRLDGTEEREDPEQWLSRSVRAGILKRQEGYSDSTLDHALDSLGGAALQDSITVQTRSGAPRVWSGNRMSLSVFSAWAAKVKATRNAYEAWQMCQEPPLPNLKPNFQVYAEMFSKLFSAEIDYTSSILPGAAKEVFPPHHVNLTEFERERLRPLSVDELYERMLRDGNRPVKHCLTLLVRNASTVEKAAQYLLDSPLDKRAVEDMTKALNPIYDSLKQIPVRVFHAYVGLLCSRQARRRWAHNPNAAKHQPQPQVLAKYDHLKRAIQLVCTRSGPRRAPAPAPWHTVMQALAHRKLVLRPWCSQEEDNVEALRTMLSLFDAYKMSEGLHPIPFDCLARCTWKALGDEGTACGPAKNAQELIATAHQTLKSTLRELTSPVQAPSDSVAESLPPLYHELSAAHIQTYLETLARLGDVDEAVQLIEWVLTSWDQNSAILEHARDPDHKQWAMLGEAFVCFRAFAEGRVSDEIMSRIEARFEELKGKGSTWLWPQDEDVYEYVEGKRGHGRAGSNGQGDSPVCKTIQNLIFTVDAGFHALTFASLAGKGARMDDLVMSDLNPGRGSGPMDLDEVLIMRSHQDDEAALVEAEAEEAEFEETDLESDFDNVQQHHPTSKKLVIEIPSSTLIAPRSAFRSPAEYAHISKEHSAVRSLLDSDPSQLDEDFVEFELDDFVVYIDTKRYPQEMRALHTHATLTGQQKFFFNGTLRLGGIERRVEKVLFEEIPLGNYGKDHPTVGDQLWICSDLNREKNIYYQLKRPSFEYARFHQDFLWVADLAKHVVDFSEHLIELGQNVSIRHFQQDFARWLQSIHGSSPTFQKWYTKRGSDDFRQSIVANERFIRKELFDMFEGQKWTHIHIFREITHPFGMFGRQGHGFLSKGDRVPYTIVTPYIYDCFSHMEMGMVLKPMQPSVNTKEATSRSWLTNGMQSPRFVRTADAFYQHRAMIDSIKPGDTISIAPDTEETDTPWSTNKADKKWYGLVQGVSMMKAKMGLRRCFDITWLYDPEDTPCCSMKYPWPNELFLSDHCTCEERQRRIPEHAVIGVHTVEWFGTPRTTAEFFIRQTYQVEQRRWISLQQAHIYCQHEKKQRHKIRYHIGETVLVLTPGTMVLEPYEVLSYGKDNECVRLRKFIRRTDIHSKCAPNDLIYTDEQESVNASRIYTRCIVRCYYPGEIIPAPYNGNGTGNAFIVSHRKSADGSIHPLSPTNKPTIREGFDPNRLVSKLRAMDLFSGCGNFGRGLEDGGAVHSKWVNDIWDAAIHTYMANVKDPDSVHPFLGSIDDFCLQAFQGKFSNSVPSPGEVDLISGGSPCPGFSMITPDKQTIQQVKNRSLVAAFAATIDFYRPKYGILENVKTIVQSKGNRTEDYFSQLICAIVGMGYQAQIILGDAWSHGSPQARVRAFLCFAAPGLELPLPPDLSHAHPRKKESGSLGMMTNGEPYVVRSNQPTPFKYVTALEATADLPDIYDAKTETCVAFPDHRLSISLSSGDLTSGVKYGRGKNGRTQGLNMPIRPFGMNFSRAWHHTIKDRLSEDAFHDMFDHERDAYPRPGIPRTSNISKAWGRVHPHGLFHTITTVCQWTDARTGRLSHWDQPRPLTVMEVRRAQGIPDHEVLLGSAKDQWEMVGNAVARQIAMALGLSLRRAWFGSLYEDGPAAPEGVDQDLESSDDGVEHLIVKGDIAMSLDSD
ncbi:hypothetical protein N8I77_006622 [Diaporthe amygdali]|uniref:DNA (cytosine-5-)-methyltransferase n=1 Tax=Phomopsis amygdali TaxID=1214568 RepID=A0AAD9SI43_PHOAM|nr:hypothetical protein N8I77_006622 [Diaporthe amygdali]